MARIKGRYWDRRTQRYIHVGYFDTVEDRDVAVATAKREVMLMRNRPREDRARGGELFETFADRFILDYRRTVSWNTWKGYNQILQLWVMPYFKDMKLRDIRSRDVDRWFHEYLPQTSPSNGQRYAVLKRIMKRAVTLEEIDRNPCLVEKVNAVKSKRGTDMKVSDFLMLVDAAATTQERALLWVLGASGCRVGEALALNWEDVAEDGMEITVSKHLLPNGEVVEGTKAHPDQVRFLVLVPQAAEALQAHRQESRGVLDQPVFTSEWKGHVRRLRYSVAQKQFVSLRASRGLDHYVLHSLRHMHLTQYGKHASLAEVMARGGHSDMRTALRYQHPSRQRDREIVAAMEGAFR